VITCDLGRKKMDFIIILLGIVLGVVGTIGIKKIFYFKGKNKKRIVGPQVYEKCA
jgi:hypothetical protein